MVKRRKTAVLGGIGIYGLLTVALLVLKLSGVISWSWWWTLTPVWLPVALLLVLIVATLVYMKFKMIDSDEDIHQW